MPRHTGQVFLHIAYKLYSKSHCTFIFIHCIQYEPEFQMIGPTSAAKASCEAPVSCSADVPLRKGDMESPVSPIGSLEF